MTGTLGREVISTRQRKIAELARREPELTLTIGVTYGAFRTDGCETECTVEQRDHYPRSRVPELGMPGSVGAAGGQPPAATRPIAQCSPGSISSPRGPPSSSMWCRQARHTVRRSQQCRNSASSTILRVRIVWEP